MQHQEPRVVREQRYQAIFEHPSEITVVLEAVRNANGEVFDWRYLDANNNALDWLNKTRPEVIDRRISEVLQDYAERLIPILARVLKTREPCRYETRAGDLDYLVSVFPISENIVVSSGVDISAEARAAREWRTQSEAMRAENEWFAAVLNSMTEEVYFTDIDGHYTYANPSAMREFGHASIHGVPVAQIIERLEVLRADGSVRPAAEAPPLRALRGEVVRDEEQIVRIPRSGALRHRQVTSAPVRNAGGEIIGSVSVVRDITEQKNAERSLLESAKRKDEFLAVLAHELRNPLAALYSAAQLLSKPSQKPATVSMARDALQRQVHHMARLLDDLLDVARITHGRVNLQQQPTDLTQVIQSAVETVRPLLDSHGHRFAVTLDGGSLFVDGDAVRLTQVLGNLLTNACKYTPPGGRIELALQRQQDRAVVTVRDNGMGIASAMLPRIFEMFNRSEDIGSGLGIGLALVKGLVEMHGGGVEARSAGEGQGSEFTITLPLLNRHELESTPARPNESDAMTPLRILVADDNADNANGWSAWLQGQGHEVRTAFDGHAAWEQLTSFKPDVALLDIGMPHLTGYELAKKVRATVWGARIKLVAITGWGQSKDRDEAKAAGFDHHLTKPTSFEEILNILAT